jgi:TolA-binding protein
MYKVALSQYELKAFRNSRATLQKLIAQYPESEAAAQARLQIDKLNAEGR